MSVHLLTAVDGVRLALRDLRGAGPRLLLVHGTSFHGAALAPLANALPGFRSFALDLRGHGASEGAALPFDWRTLRTDARCALDELLERESGPIYGFGHSAGATALLFAAAERPEAFAALYLFEPIALSPAIRASVPLPGALEGAARRRDQFSDEAEALAFFAERPPLSSFDRGVLEAYVHDGLTPSAQGLRLACSPAYEAAVYRAGYDTDCFEELLGASCPVTVAVGAASTGIGPACAPLLAGALAHAELLTLGGLGHLGPLEAPRVVADSVATALAGGG